jgi:cysteine desulfurase/selenocysteine lyase
MNSKNFSEIKEDFNNFEVVYLDNAATTFCPRVVAESLSDYHLNYKANIHRGIHKLSEKATSEYEGVRTKIKNFINAKKDNEIVFTYGTTHSINLIAEGLCSNWNKKDCVIVLESEHHANLLPWMNSSKKYGFRFEKINVIKDGSIDLAHLEEILESCEGKIIFCMAHINNTIGYVQPVKDVFSLAKEYNAITVLDAAQSISKERIDVDDMMIDFMAFSGHKIYGPTGVGVLYGKQKLLDKLEPMFWGGDMISQVHWDDVQLNQLPWRLEAGTPNIGGVIALGAAIDWFTSYDFDSFHSHNLLMNANIQMALNDLDFVEIFHPGTYKGGLISFNIKGCFPSDVAQILDLQNIAVRSGFLCAQPIVEEKFANGVVRASWACYNTKEDIEKLKKGLVKAYEMLNK